MTGYAVLVKITLKRYTVFLAIPVYLQDLFAGHHDFVFLSQSYRHFTPLSICSCPEAYCDGTAAAVYDIRRLQIGR